MRGLSLKNVRSLRDTGLLQIKPITILLGQNSSGKSTFLRTFPLIAQSLGTRTNTPILWFGDSVDFGSVREVISSADEVSSLEIEVDFGLVDVTDRYGLRNREDLGDEYRVAIELFEQSERTSLRKVTLTTNDHTLHLTLNERGAIDDITINGKSYAKFVPNDDFRIDSSTLVPQLRRKPKASSVAQEAILRRSDGRISPAFEQIQKIFRRHLHGRTSEETFYHLSRRLKYVTGQRFYNNLKVNRASLKSWPSFRAKVEDGPQSAVAQEIHSLVLLAELPEILFALQRRAAHLASDISYIGPSRATGERYYRIQELAVDAIDPQGKNLPMFLYSLSVQKLEEFSEWLVDAIGYEIQVDRSVGHVQIKLRAKDSEEYFNIADMGYGFSQILPVLAQIWMQTEYNRRRMSSTQILMAIEQPELHLHPAYQALFADTLAAATANKKKSRENKFIIETHSEALINRLGELVERKLLKASDIAIYIFEKNHPDSATSVRRACFDDAGILENWPFGFFSSRVD